MALRRLFLFPWLIPLWLVSKYIFSRESLHLWGTLRSPGLFSPAHSPGEHTFPDYIASILRRRLPHYQNKNHLKWKCFVKNWEEINIRAHKLTKIENWENSNFPGIWTRLVRSNATWHAKSIVNKNLAESKANSCLSVQCDMEHFESLQKLHLPTQLASPSINNDNKIEWSPIRSVIIRVINKTGRPRSGSPICLSRVWLLTELDDNKSCYQLIITISISKQTNTPRTNVSGGDNVFS